MDNEQLLEKLLAAVTLLTDMKAMEEGLKTKTPALRHTGIKLHGAGGIFQGPGLERDIITAHVRPFGIGSELDLLPSTSEDPRFGSLTGFTATIGSQPTYVCDDAPTSYMKGCNLTARFGLLRFDTNTIDMDVVMRKTNRGDFTDLVLRGRLLGLSDLEPSGLNEGQVLDIITMAEMIATGVNMERELNKQLWQGVTTIVNNFPGLDVQIATG